MISRSRTVRLCSCPSQGRAVRLGLATVSLALCAVPCLATPVITSVNQISTQQLQRIVIAGKGFGNQSPYTGNSSYIALFDLDNHAPDGWSAGFDGIFPGGFLPGVPASTPVFDAVTLIVNSWSDSSIVLGGFSGAFGFDGWTLSHGDEIEIFVWNAQTGIGPASIVCFVDGACASTATQTPEPGSLALVGAAIGLLGTLRLRPRPRQKHF